MEPERRLLRSFATRTRAFFVAVVLLASFLFQTVRSASASVPQDAEEGVDAVLRRKNPADRSSLRSDDRIPKISGTRGFHSTVDLREEPRFSWPPPPEGPGRPGFLSSNPASFFEGPGFQAELKSDPYRQCDSDPMADFRDALLRVPELLLDGVLLLCGGLSGRSDVRLWEDEDDRSMTDRLSDIRIAPRQHSLFAEFIRQWILREQKYFGEFDESRASRTGFWGRTSGADMDELAIDQRRLFWDALKRTYLSRYLLQSEDEVREGAWSPGRWRGKDFVLLPPLIGAYLYFFGFEKKISIGDMSLRFSFEPVSAFLHPTSERSMASALEWRVDGIPVGVIVSAGFHDGRYGLEFVGIGTSLGIVRRAIDLQTREWRP